MGVETGREANRCSALELTRESWSAHVSKLVGDFFPGYSRDDTVTSCPFAETRASWTVWPWLPVMKNGWWVKWRPKDAQDLVTGEGLRGKVPRKKGTALEHVSEGPREALFWTTGLLKWALTAGITLWCTFSLHPHSPPQSAHKITMAPGSLFLSEIFFYLWK